MLSCCIVLTITQFLFSQVRLPALISDGMVLQRDTELKIWGWADVNETVKINFKAKEYSAKPDQDGKWFITLERMQAGGPYEMQISGTNSITLRNILAGDVWLCSGQSNIELPVSRVLDRYPDLAAKSENPNIRNFLVLKKYDFKSPQEDLSGGKWKSSNPENVLEFSAVGYFFAKNLYEKYKVPIGLITSGYGGSPVQSWMSEDALEKFPEHLQTAEKFKDANYVDEILHKNKQTSDEWYSRLNQLDKGNQQSKWYDVNYPASDWDSMEIPGYWADQRLGKANGVVWFRKEIDVPDVMVGKPAKLLLGCIVDADTAYVNGKFVGTTSYQYPPRKYDIPADIIKAGKNIIVIRVINTSGRGGFVKEKPYQLSVGENTIDLKGKWLYKLGAKMEPLPPSTFVQWQPEGLYNAMIAPLLDFKIKGVVWYQGESNTGKPENYYNMFSTMITDWWQKWNQGNFPFLYVQLANFMQARETPSESNWAMLREQQLKTLNVPNTAMAVAIDLGEWNDIHPLNKEDVGKRLALAAQKLAYDNDIVYSGPIYDSMEIKENKIILSFANTGSGLIAKGGELKQFAIAGADKKFIWAKAEINGDKVIVWNDSIAEPAAVRYAWADNPEGANLYNKEGLPASPFRTEEKFNYFSPSIFLRRKI
ncbi:MAG: 9-O-acetylesterase [Planctomycetes bacterium GWF2_41_51]|nr:MAG: 9-O-acetylesterase [Planctomycetes bacterium GWF2_41_51]